MQALSRTTRWFLIGLLVLSVIPYLVRPAPAFGQTECTPEAVSGGGGESQSGSFVIYDTIAQGPVGPEPPGAG